MAQLSTNEVLRLSNPTRNPHKQRRYEYHLNETHQIKKMKQSSESIDHSPEGYAILEGMNGSTANLHCLGLFDSGSTSTLLNKRAIPKDVQPQTGHPQQFTTTQGNYVSDGILKIKKIFFPQFCKARYVPNVSVRIFDSPTSWYDVIFGRDVLTCGFVLDHSTKKISRDGLSIPMTMETAHAPTDHYICTHFQCALSFHASYAAATHKILDAKYEKISPDGVIAQAKVLQRIQTSEWAFPSFIIPKKDGRVRLVSDFRRLNRLLKNLSTSFPTLQLSCKKELVFAS